MPSHFKKGVAQVWSELASNPDYRLLMLAERPCNLVNSRDKLLSTRGQLHMVIEEVVHHVDDEKHEGMRVQRVPCLECRLTSGAEPRAAET